MSSSVLNAIERPLRICAGNLWKIRKFSSSSFKSQAHHHEKKEHIWEVIYVGHLHKGFFLIYKTTLRPLDVIIINPTLQIRKHKLGKINNSCLQSLWVQKCDFKPISLISRPISFTPKSRGLSTWQFLPNTSLWRTLL